MNMRKKSIVQIKGMIRAWQAQMPRQARRVTFSVRSKTIQGYELRVRLTESAPSDACPESEMVGFTEERQTVLFDENTIFEIRVIANRVFARTEPGRFTDLYPHDSITVYGQDQGDMFVAEKIAIWVIE